MSKLRTHAQLLHALDTCLRVLVEREGNIHLILDIMEVREIFRDLLVPEAVVRLADLARDVSGALGQARELLGIARKQHTAAEVFLGPRIEGDAMSNNDPVGTCDECGDNIYDHDLEDRDDVEAVKEDEPLICSECAARKRSLAR